MHGIGKRLVYVLRSDSDPARHYIGVTSDVENRLDGRRRHHEILRDEIAQTTGG